MPRADLTLHPVPDQSFNVGSIGHGGNRRCQATAGTATRIGNSGKRQRRIGREATAGQATAGQATSATENREGISATETGRVFALPVRIATDCPSFSANGNYTGDVADSADITSPMNAPYWPLRRYPFHRPRSLATRAESSHPLLPQHTVSMSGIRSIHGCCACRQCD